jgi:hypothetical protein
MTIKDVEAAKQALEQSGAYPSADRILAHLGHGSKKPVLRRLRAMAAARSPVPHTTDDTPTENNGTMSTRAVPMPPPPTPLLQQAEEALEAALMAERRARRDYDMAPRAERERLEEAWVAARKTRENAATLVQQRQRARDRLIASLPAARVAARHAAGTLAILQDETSRRLLKAAREATLAQDDLGRIVQDLTQIAGESGVPRETS